MKISLITLSTPTFNNTRAASALPYHLILGAKDNGKIEFEIYSFNLNGIDDDGIEKVEQALDVHIHLVKMPSWILLLSKLHLLVLRVFLRYPILSYLSLPQETIKNISSSAPDAIWIYGEELARLGDHFRNFPCIVTMPDCESMYYYRMLSKNFATRNLAQILRYAYAYWQYRGMEQAFFRKGVKYHFVGEADADFYRNINPEADSRFIRHPLYEYKRNDNVGFHKPKIKVLIAGRNDVYMKEDTDDLMHELKLEANELKRHFEFTFLGNGWEPNVELLRECGYEVDLVVFADDYIKELQRHDIQITPISVGTGTKGKVLDAVANGLLIMGTEGAVENIAVENGQSAILFSTGRDAIEKLKIIFKSPEIYHSMAAKGTQQVLIAHDRSLIARQVFYDLIYK